jgi:hypothetical protein
MTSLNKFEVWQCSSLLSKITNSIQGPGTHHNLHRDVTVKRSHSSPSPTLFFFLGCKVVLIPRALAVWLTPKVKDATNVLRLELTMKISLLSLHIKQAVKACWFLWPMGWNSYISSALLPFLSALEVNFQPMPMLQFASPNVWTKFTLPISPSQDILLHFQRIVRDQKMFNFAFKKRTLLLITPHHAFFFAVGSMLNFAPVLRILYHCLLGRHVQSINQRDGGEIEKVLENMVGHMDRSICHCLG